MFEVTAEDCAKLDDRQLRELVGLLCEAELTSRGLPASVVTWGGDQNAGDGGIDVRVALSSGAGIDGFVPRASVGFQVKKLDLSKAAIREEMRPGNRLREAIIELADQGGAYIIVSAGSVSDVVLRRRKAAMTEAVEDAPAKGALLVDYYDRTRLASWVRTHPGVALWVRQRIGRALAGWEGFGPWAYPSGGSEASFLLDDAVRICRRPAHDGSELGAEAGLLAIRTILAEPRSVIRLVGLSGVGKTRLAQALFDQRVGTASLDPALAVFCNMNDAPDPQPVGLASNLIAGRSRAVMIVDNCGAELHRSLTGLVKQPASRLTIMTIEYDIRDDQPEETDVFELQAASGELIEELVRLRFPAVSAVDARTAASVSGGNARIAIALAGTVAGSGTLAGLSDDALFQRLFLQRQPEDKSLREQAQALSLVYSFHGEEMGEGEAGELHALGSIIGVSSDQLFRTTSELLDRDLAQRRGPWRAILPHAIANRLAAEALRRIPFRSIEQAIIERGSERLIRSFSRRLGYLHASPQAQQIVERWFARGGWLADAWNLDRAGSAFFTNVVPVAPCAGLAAIERSMPRAPESGCFERGYGFIRRAVRSVAYDAHLFDRALAVLEFLSSHADERGSKEAGRAHASLFHLYLSGTMAPVDARIASARRLLGSSEGHLRTLGLEAFSALLEGSHFMGHGDYSFGARSRDYGWRPTCEADVADWFGRVFGLMSELRDEPVAVDMRACLAGKFRGIWSQPAARGQLEDVCLGEARCGFWAEGWRAVKMTRSYDAEDRDSREFGRLTTLEEALRPRGLVERVRGRVLARQGGSYDFDACEDLPDARDTTDLKSVLDREAAMVESLGKLTAEDMAALDEMLPDLFLCEGDLWNFGRGLARGAMDAQALWDTLVGQLARLCDRPVGVNVLRGFLNALAGTDPALTAAFLDRAVTSQPLAPRFPLLQVAVDLDGKAVGRLLQAIEIGSAPMWTFENLAFGRATDPLTGEQLAEILRAIAGEPDGVGTAIRILQMRFHSGKVGDACSQLALIEAGRALLSAVRFRKGQGRLDHEIGDIIGACLAGPDGVSIATVLCTNLREAVTARDAYAHDYTGLLERLLGVQPEAVLDAFLGGDAGTAAAGIAIIDDASTFGRNPMDAVSGETLIAWCQHDGARRYPAAAASVGLFAHGSEGRLELSSVARMIMAAAPDRLEILRKAAGRCRPSSWSGSRAAILESRAAALASIDVSDDGSLDIVLKTELAALAAEARSSRDWELAHDSDRDERFE